MMQSHKGGLLPSIWRQSNVGGPPSISVCRLVRLAPYPLQAGLTNAAHRDDSRLLRPSAGACTLTGPTDPPLLPPTMFGIPSC